MGKSRIAWRFNSMPDEKSFPQFIPRMLLQATYELTEKTETEWIKKDDLEAYLAETDMTGYNRLRSISPLKQTMTRWQHQLARAGHIDVTVDYGDG